MRIHKSFISSVEVFPFGLFTVFIDTTKLNIELALQIKQDKSPTVGIGFVSMLK